MVPRITIFERYVLRECLSSFLVSGGVLTAILFVAMAFKVLTQAKGLDMVDVLELSPLILPFVIVHVLPLTMLIATLSTYTRLSSDREIIAMNLAGVPVRRLAAPTVFLGLALALGSLWTSNTLIPRSDEKLNAFVQKAVTKLIAELSGSRNSIEYEGPRFSWKFHWKGVKNGRLRDIIVYKVPRRGPGPGETTPRSPQILCAASGTFRLDPYGNLVKFELQGLLGYLDLPAGNGAGPGSEARGLLDRRRRDQRLAFRGDTFAVTVDLDWAEAEDDLRIRPRDRDLPNLMALRARDLEQERNSRRNIDTEVHSRLALALSTLTFALLGAALGLLFRSQNRIVAYVTGFVVGAIVYFPLSRIGEGASEAGALAPALGPELGNLALLALALILFRRVSQ